MKKTFQVAVVLLGVIAMALTAGAGLGWPWT